MGVKFSESIGDGLALKALPLFIEMRDHRGNGQGGRIGMCVFKLRPSHLTEDGTYIFSLKNGIMVIWDRGFSVADVQKIMAEIDQQAYSNGNIVDGKRAVLPAPEPDEPVKFKVEAIFTSAGAVMLAPYGIDDEQVLNNFDRPELLGIIQLGLIRLICLKSGLSETTERFKRSIQRLTDMGITREKISQMTPEELKALKEQLRD